MTMEPPPPPPPPPSPSGRPAGGEPVNIGEAVNYGWNAYWKNVGPMVVIALVIFGDQHRVLGDRLRIRVGRPPDRC